MFEIELDPSAIDSRVELASDLIRFVIPPDMPFKIALNNCNEDILRIVHDAITELFASGDCPRQYKMDSGRLIISQRNTD